MKNDLCKFANHIASLHGNQKEELLEVTIEEMQLANIHSVSEQQEFKYEVTHINEPPIADYITQYYIDTLNFVQFADILKPDIEKAPTDSKTLSIDRSGILYAKHLGNCSEVTRLADCATFRASLSGTKKTSITLTIY